MKISGFTMVKNVSKLYYPIKESIASILDLVDEFVVALGDCDPDDNTQELIESLNSPKIKIIHTTWDTAKYPRGMENAHQTDIAKAECTGDWLFYLQADEVVHEKYHAEIKSMCEKNLDDERVEGFLFNYIHFWGDFDHYQHKHGWYPSEIRIVRNRKDIHSWKSAQSFRRIPNFDGLNYRVKEGTFKLGVKKLEAYIYHYGWVRPPKLMTKKSASLNKIHSNKVDENDFIKPKEFDYGPMLQFPKFKGTHPKVMKDWIAAMDWKDQLNYSKYSKSPENRLTKKAIKVKTLTWIENNLLGGKKLFTTKNYKLIK
ncbi:glycosyltransferase family 2 protein [Marivirga arenosa]|uniref:Glycosyltransferase family 2 protein n=1 Tax=Marivirga arenosa TaxID=3059076 RepID=A0AA49GEJ3_9BACT|nr:glycosyltransferase family 2 protein [Marivirga sp. ABR2-2]WKK85903.2 glycosyltransferase family 2 protein [Marivirga sp. ABR2-2]